MGPRTTRTVSPSPFSARGAPARGASFAPSLRCGPWGRDVGSRAPGDEGVGVMRLLAGGRVAHYGSAHRVIPSRVFRALRARGSRHPAVDSGAYAGARRVGSGSDRAGWRHASVPDPGRRIIRTCACAATGPPPRSSGGPHRTLIGKVRHLLEATDLPVEPITVQVGFPSPTPSVTASSMRPEAAPTLGSAPSGRVRGRADHGPAAMGRTTIGFDRPLSRWGVKVRFSTVP